MSSQLSLEKNSGSVSHALIMSQWEAVTLGYKCVPQKGQLAFCLQKH